MENNMNDLVLIVDDNPNNIRVFATVIDECGYSSGFAMNGKQALAFLEENIPSLILLDIMMPDMNGYDVCKKIKENPSLKDIPIIFLTAKSEHDDIIKGFEVGAVDYVTKPFNRMELKMRIKTHIELQQNKRKLVELNKNLEKANLTKDKFFSIIAHDLRSPIGTISQYIDFISEELETLDKSSLLDDFKILKKLSKTSYELLENLLFWAFSQKDIALECKPVKGNIYELVENNINLFKQIANKKSILLKNEVEKNLEALFDYNMIETVIRNILNNAIKYTNNKGLITISAKDNSDYIEISIKDNGIGMSSYTIEKLFIIDETKSSQDGTSGEVGFGFGLVLCKEFIEKHKGKIWVESEQGKGSEFKFTIPKLAVN